MDIPQTISLKKEMKSNKYIKKSKYATKEREELELPPIISATSVLIDEQKKVNDEHKNELAEKTKKINQMNVDELGATAMSRLIKDLEREAVEAKQNEKNMIKVELHNAMAQKGGRNGIGQILLD
jgi:small-conductance mechanosensitive channel